ncbi:GNAT family N-acetyltransferase [Hymenobacter aquaticus]|uniref:GNAT family N-acetyltransferase n=1 Tax=Hymenobacter aquaticus TaxID=1867101 RepID=A0A4Z0Q3A3_9BACT|nr:GNAT family N-acetyltransferase [Hymenobacter aquaticus]TGE23946.1 GNAT family N-acetyltransferase [Hymenobacter aquaticus]
MHLDLNLLERWLTGWSLARGVALPRAGGGGLVVEVGWPGQVRRHVFVEAGPALRACAARIREPLVYLKAAVGPDELRRALPAAWQIEEARYLMYCPGPMAAPAGELPAGYAVQLGVEHGASVLCLVDAAGQTAATGRVVVHRGTAVFDRIETMEGYRRRGLGSAVMHALDQLARQAGATERLLVATEQGRALYQRLGWRVVAPYSTAVLAAL